MQPIVDALNALSGPNAFKYVVYTENHDKDDASGGGGRLPTSFIRAIRCWESKKRSDAGRGRGDDSAGDPDDL